VLEHTNNDPEVEGLTLAAAADTGGPYHKTYCSRNLRTSIISVCPWQAFPASLFFAGKGVAYPSEAPFRCSTLR
jgi:hypothetical protein